MTGLHPPFDRFGEAEARRWQSAAESRTLRKGRSLYFQGDPADGAALVLEGRLRLVMLRSDDTLLEAGDLGSGDWVGLAEALVCGPRLADAVAAETCRLLVFGGTLFRRFAALPETGAWLTGELARQCYALHSRIEVTQPGQRLARWLGGRPAGWLVLTQDELAAAVGTTRETVNRQLGRLQAEGLVEVGRGRVRVIDPGALAAWL